MEWIRIRTPSGYELPLAPLAHADPVAHVLVTPALGVPARFYRPLGESLQRRGYDVALFEQRGHGESALRAGRSVDFGWAEYVEEDLPVALDWLAREHATRPRLIVGHSLGGHLGACLVGLRPELVQGLVLAGVGFPSPRLYPRRIRYSIRLLKLLVPSSLRTLGYYPGHRLGFGGRESRGVMRGWMTMARKKRYSIPGVASSDALEEGMARWEGRCLQLGFSEDSYAPPSATDPVTALLRRAPVEKRVMSETELGARADHFRWAREGAPAVAEAIDRWWREVGREQTGGARPLR